MNKISKREKVLLVVLILLIIGSAYYMLFYTPTKEKMAQYEAELLEIDDRVLVAEAQLLHMKNMQKELDELLAEGADKIKEAPLYDNSKKLMESLNLILRSAMEYNISFVEANVESHIVRRDVSLSYQCATYKQAKEILQNIHDGKYPCIIKDVSLTYDENYSIRVALTYYEYME